ncbi:exonuclease mut-7 homolog [Culicoides brevitarsis]|uniref:exonuclease mut-7 homolog n=1 Tax=Culicoides brevitarsis TaxID=469753 RepID=UPI00307CBF97
MSASKPAGFDSDEDDDYFEIDPEKNFDDEFGPDSEDCFYVAAAKNSLDRYLNGIKFDYTLEDEDLTLMDKLLGFYQDNGDKYSALLANDVLLQALDQKKNDIFNENPFSFVLKLLINTDLLDDPHVKSVPFKIITVLNQYLRGLDPESLNTLQCMITDHLKHVAFEISYKHLAFFREVLQAFKLKTRCDAINARLKEMLAGRDYKSVARIVDSLGYWNDFAPEAIIIPLIFRDQLQVAEDFFPKMSLQRKEETFKLLDSFFEHEYAVYQACTAFAKQHKITGIKIVKLDTQPLRKTTEKLLELSGMPLEKLPNLNRIAMKGRLMANLRRYEKFTDAENRSACDRTVKKIVKMDDKEMQELVIEFYMQNGHHTLAKGYCKYFKIPQEKFYKEEIAVLDENHNNEDQEKSKFPPFVIDSRVKIITVDDSSSFERMCFLLNQLKFVSIDVEGDSRFSSAALIQISTKQEVYIVDIIELEKRRFDIEEWKILKKTLFDNTKILKLGFDWHADILMLERSFNIEFDVTNGSYLDLKVAWETMRKNPKFKLPFEYDKGDGRKHQDLKTFVEFCLGKTLDKSLRTKDFAMRPLTDKMKNYAAIDAHSLLHAYFEFRRKTSYYGGDVKNMYLK